MHFDREGRPISLDEWVQLRKTHAYRRVALDTVGPYIVSTVWLGLDHGLWSERPIIFETMVFSADEFGDTTRAGLHDIDCRRYATEAEAVAGHEETLTLLRATVQEGPDASDAAGTQSPPES